MFVLDDSHYKLVQQGAYYSLSRLLVLFLALAFVTTRASEASVVTYNHSADLSARKSIAVPVQLSQFITLNVINTCDSSKITASGVSPINDSASSPDLFLNASAATVANTLDQCAIISNERLRIENELKVDTCFLSNKTVEIPHKPEFDAYLVKISVSDGQSKRSAISVNDYNAVSKNAKEMVANACGMINGATDTATKTTLMESTKKELTQLYEEIPTVELRSTEIVINVQTDGWLTDFSGGVVVSNLTDPVFALSNAEDITTITRVKGSEDAHSLVFGAFTHVYHSTWRDKFFNLGTPAITAGLSVNNGSKLDYFVGPSIKFGSAFVNLGLHWGQVARLPTSFFEGQEVTEDVATLNSISESGLESKSERGVYFSITYTFGGQGASPLTSRLALPSENQPSTE